MQCPNCQHKFTVEHFHTSLPPHLSKTNNCPLPHEEELVRGAIIPDSEFEDLDDTISRVQSYLDALKLRKQAMEEHRASRHSILSPIRRIPPEIVREIVLHACGYYQRRPLDVRGLWRSPQFVLGRVCGSWRVEINSCPALWADIHLDFRYDRPKDALDRTGRILDRALDHPLRISFISGSYERPEDDHILSLILSYSRRWQHVRLEMPEWYHLKTMKWLRKGLPHLRHLVLKLDREYGDSHLVRPFGLGVNSLSEAWALQSLHLKHFELSSMDIPWSQLTHLTIEPCPRVMERDGRTDICLPQLQRLSILSTGGLPRLEIPPILLELELVQDHDLLVYIMEMIHRCGTSVQALTLLLSPGICTSQWDPFLRHMQSISVLHITEQFRLTDYLNVIEAGVLPNLQTLVLHFEPARNLANGVMKTVDAIKGFIHRHATLHSIIFQGRPLGNTFTEDDVVHALSLTDGRIRVEFQEEEWDYDF